MKPLPIADIAAAIGADYSGPARLISDICTDTRSLRPGCLFVALEGENFDGHDYIPMALEKGAAFALSHKTATGGDRVLAVTDTRAALLAVAGLYRRLMSPKVAGITGSVGKTTVKEMTACVLESAFKTLKTPENRNNEVGLSSTILSLEEEHRAAVLELGVDGPGQMSRLARCAAPDVGLVTGIGTAHLANYGSRGDIMKEKLAIRDGMADGAALLLCGDNDLLAGVRDSRLKVLRYGLENPVCGISAANLREENGQTAFDILWEGAKYPALLPALGRHNVQNALGAFAAGIALGVEPDAAAGALANYRTSGMRQNQVSHGGMTIVEDCYNASPDSMRAALATLGEIPAQGRRIAVLSDMLELGENEEEEHRQTGVFAASRGIDMLLCAGNLSRLYEQGARESGMKEAYHFPGQDELYGHIAKTAKPGDVLWFKASRGMRLEQVILRIYDSGQ